MKKFLVKNALLAFSNESNPSDYFIQNNSITKFDGESLEDVEVIESSELIIFNNLTDTFTAVSEPGFEHRETIEQTILAALDGGFTSLIALPDTEPCIDNRANIEFLMGQSHNSVLKIFPLSTITKEGKGKDLADLNENFNAGAVGFIEGDHYRHDSGILLRAMDYVKAFDGLIITNPFDASLAILGEVHEGVQSLNLGLRGIPPISESIRVARDIELAKFSKCKLLLNGISTIESVSLIRKAKADGLKVYASVNVNNLIFDDQALSQFDTNYKVFPPLRDLSTQKVLWEAVKDGVIDIISSQHKPIEVEKKEVEFPYASFGTIGLQTCVLALLEEGSDISHLNVIQEKLGVRPNEIFNLSLEENKFSIFEKVESYVYTSDLVISQSRNSPFFGRSFHYKLKKII